MAATNKTSRGPIVVLAGPGEDTITQKSLEEIGFEPVFVKDPNKVFAVMAGKPDRWKPTMFLVDVMLPSLGGFEVVRRLNEKFGEKTTPIVMMSPHDSAEDRLESMNLGCVSLLKKPVTADMILQLLEQEKIKKLKSQIGTMAFDINYE